MKNMKNMKIIYNFGVNLFEIGWYLEYKTTLFFNRW